MGNKQEWAKTHDSNIYSVLTRGTARLSGKSQ